MSSSLRVSPIYIYKLRSIFAALLCILMASFMSIILGSSVLAESFNYDVTVEQALNITVSSSNISLDLNPETKQFETKDLSIKASTNYINGYKLYINAASSSLTNDDYVNINGNNNGPTFYIPTLTSSSVASSFPANYLGYIISSGSSGDPSITNLNSSLSNINDATFYPFSSGTLVSSSPSAVNENETTLTFVAKADYDKPAGSYTNTFSYIM